MNKTKDALQYYHDTRYAIARSQHKKADVSKTRVFRLNKSNWTYYFGMAEGLMNQEEYKKACPLYKKSLIINPKNSKASYSLGYSLQMLGTADEAYEMFQKTLSLDPKYSEAHYSLAVNLTEKGSYEEGQEHYMEAIKLNPGLGSMVYNCLGYSYFLQGEFAKAMSEFEKSIDLEKEYTLAYCNMSLVLFCENKDEEAVKFFEEGMKSMSKYQNKSEKMKEMIMKYQNEKVGLETKLNSNEVFNEEKMKVIMAMIHGLTGILELLDGESEREKNRIAKSQADFQFLFDEDF